MDVYCQYCEEPWDVYSVHEMDDDQEWPGGNKADFLNGVGCPACDWGTDASAEFRRGESIFTRSDAMSVMGDLLGDDIDGMAAMIDDWDYIGGFD